MKLIKPYFILANCILLVLAAYLGVKTAYGVASVSLQTTRPRVTAGEKADAPTRKARRPLAHYHSIDKRNLFNIKKETAKKAPEPENLEELEPTELKLKLWGTAPGTVDNDSYAVIEDLTTRTQNLYRQGDTVQEATVKMILNEKVILRVNDKDEILEMEKMATAGSSSSRTFRPPLAPARRSAPRTQKISVERSEIDEALANVNDLMQQVRIMPHFDNGEPDGFRLSGIKTNSLIRKMGLRNGDIITGVNGQPIQTMDDALGFYKQLSGASDMSVDIKRRGRERRIDYSIK